MNLPPADHVLTAIPAAHPHVSQHHDVHPPVCNGPAGCSRCRPYFVCECLVPAECPDCEPVYLQAVTAAWRAEARNPHQAAASAFRIARAGYNPELGPFAPYLMTIARRIGRSDLRRERKWQMRKVALPEDAEFVDESATEGIEQLLSDMDRPFLRNSLAQALRRLDWRKRQYLWLRFWKGLTNDEIFAHPHCMIESLSSCSGRKSRVHRAVIALRSLYFARSPRPSCPSVATRPPRRSRRQTRRSSHEAGLGQPS
jgi:DNA-directed RNA polymerase specialized sigma24 family protein